MQRMMMWFTGHGWDAQWLIESIDWTDWWISLHEWNEPSPFQLSWRDMKLWCCWSNVVLQASWIFEILYIIILILIMILLFNVVTSVWLEAHTLIFTLSFSFLSFFLFFELRISNIIYSILFESNLFLSSFFLMMVMLMMNPFPATGCGWRFDWLNDKMCDV